MTYYRDVPGVAVIGFSFRLPGGGADETLWQALLARRDLVTRLKPIASPKTIPYTLTRLNPGRPLRSQRALSDALREPMQRCSEFSRSRPSKSTTRSGVLLKIGLRARSV
jgi:hypothetical protein